MNGFSPHTMKTAPEGSRDGLREVEQGLGFIPNMMAVLAESPAALDAYQGIHAAFARSSFSAAEQQFLALSVSICSECYYCVPVYSLFAKKAGVPEEVINAVRDGKVIRDGRYSALRSFAAAVIKKRGQVSGAEVDNFKDAGFTKAQVLEVIIAAAFKLISNYTNHIADIPLDEAFQSFLWKEAKAA
ncbi:MAG: carboxymuconolactone decarboxylase family protein [Alphaproteobacteria bacterium]|jgi:uncharacterized peroxidase-related enzyme|nr:carboxymuconolactone decarboxylase family protein [Alphaproteobacteria bacterium]MBT7942534.1 carboxymuconolactone decarboxylase family protein [Alphaproteobacteria bacterium]